MRLRLGGGPHHLHPGRQRVLKASLDLGRGPGPDHVDIVEAPHPVQEFLGRADVHEQHRAVQGIKAGSGGEDAGYPQGLPPRSHHHGQGVPDLQVQTRRQRPADQDRVGPGEKVSRGRVAQPGGPRKFVIPKRPLGEGIDPQEQDGAAVVPGEFQDGFHRGRRGRNRRQAPHLDEQGFVQRGAGGLDTPLGLTGYGGDPGLKALQGAGRGQGNAQIDRGPQGDAQDPQEGAPGILRQVAQGNPEKPGSHASSRPS